MTLLSETVTLFRTIWTDRFVDTVSISSPIVGGTFNPSTLAYDGGSASSRYTGAALVRPGAVEVRELESQETESYLPVDVFVPYTVDSVVPDDVVSVAVSEDPRLVGSTLTVRAIEVDSYLTRRRLRCELNLGRGSGRG